MRRYFLSVAIENALSERTAEFSEPRPSFDCDAIILAEKRKKLSRGSERKIRPYFLN